MYDICLSLRIHLNYALGEAWKSSKIRLLFCRVNVRSHSLWTMVRSSSRNNMVECCTVLVSSVCGHDTCDAIPITDNDRIDIRN